MESLKKIYELFPKKDKVKLLILFGMMMVASMLEVLGIGMVPIFVLAIADSDALLNLPVVGELLQSADIVTSELMVVYGALLLIAVYLFKNAYLVWYMYVKKKFILNRGIYLQNRLFKAYMTAPYTFYINRNAAELLRNVTAEVNKIVKGTMLPFLEVSLKVIMFTFIIGTLFYLDPLITVITIILMGGIGYLFLRYTQYKTEQYGKKDRDARKHLNLVVLQGLGGFKEARVLNREKMFLENYDYHAQITKRAGVYSSIVKELPKPIIESLLVIGILAITLIMVWEGRAFTAIIPVLTLFGVSAVKLMPIFNAVISEITTIRYSAYSVYALYDDLKLLESEYKGFRENILGETERIKLKNSIELKNISFNYPEGDEFAVNDVSLSIPKGHAIAFVGPSGAGKTTIVDIILGLLEPQNGRIEVDGIDISTNIRGWMKNIGYIPQQIYLLDDNIKRNVALGIPDYKIDDEKFWRALRAAQLEELVLKMPRKERTKIGERGIRLSGGQQQRIGIARALYNNPQVLVMDEATSALDNITEKFVIEAIEHLRGDRTIIMIAHRLTTVRNCDTIYMMQDGRIVGQGTYDELLDSSKEFRKMSLVED